jgi:hypothetical protein
LPPRSFLFGQASSRLAQRRPQPSINRVNSNSIS